MSKDPQKYRLYASERVFDNAPGVRHFRSMPEMEAFVAKVVGSEWWQENGGPREVKVFLGRRDSGKAKAYSRFSMWRGEMVMSPFITIPPSWAATDITLIHELAHTFVGNQHGHDQVYAKSYLDLLRMFAGSVAADKLQAAFDKQRVEYGNGSVKGTRRVEAEAARESLAAREAAEIKEEDLRAAKAFLSLLSKFSS